MDELILLKSLVIIFGVSALAVFILGKLKTPPIAGFLLAGVIIGPHGIGLIKETGLVERLAEIGVILLLFIIGLEFSLRGLKANRRAIFTAGFMQVALTTAAVLAVGLALRQEFAPSLVYGFLIALSSTAVVMKLLFDRAEMDSPHGRLSVAILIFQDLSIVLFVLLIPVLAGSGQSLAGIGAVLVKSALIVAFILFAARWLVPAVLHQVVRTRVRELFIITITFISLGSAFLTYKLGLSLALGAFAAGLVISESEYAWQTVSELLPLKDSMSGLFFISVGMLMDLGFFAANAGTVLALVLGIILVKTVSGSIALMALGNNLRVSMHSGLVLSQVGEFSFILAVAAVQAGLLGARSYQLFLAGAVLTIMLTPALVWAAPGVSAWAGGRKALRRAGRAATAEKAPAGPSGHVVIVGFGLNGRNLARVLRELEVPYLVLEMNSDTVRKMRRKGEPIHFGDAANAEILHKAGVQRARVLVTAIADPASTRLIVANARKINPDLYIIVRTRYSAESAGLIGLGADKVIPEEFETSIEIFSRVLQYYRMPQEMIREYARRIREDHYRLFTSPDSPKRMFHDIVAPMPEITGEALTVEEGSPAEGKTIGELKIRNLYGANVISVRRGAETVFPTPESTFREGDIAFVLGPRETIAQVKEVFRRPSR